MDNSHSNIQSLHYPTYFFSSSFTWPLFKRQAAILLMPRHRNTKHKPPPHAQIKAVTKPVGKGKEDAPHWAQLGFEKVNHFSSTKFQHGQQRRDSVLRPHTHLIRRSVPSSSYFSPILHSCCLSVTLEGLSSLIYHKQCCQQYFHCCPWLWNDRGFIFWELHATGVKGTSATGIKTNGRCSVIVKQ